MKKHLLKLLLAPAAFLLSAVSLVQAQLAPDQNPNFAVSRAKYMNVSDSVNRWHGTTQQNTYKAIDWIADRQEAREERREFRRQLRMSRARWGNYYLDDNYYYPSSYRNRWGNNYYRNNYRRNGSFFLNPWGTGYWWR